MIKEHRLMLKYMKIITLSIVVLILVSIAALYAVADNSDTIMVSLRIEGIKESMYYDKAIELVAGTNVADLMRNFRGMNGAPRITIKNSEYGAYISEIRGLTEFDYGEMSGWNYRVNGTEPTLGISQYELEDGDAVVCYYGAPYSIGMQYPVANWSSLLSDGVISFTSTDTVYDEDWNPTVRTNPVVGATVMFRWDIYTTDSTGKIRIEDKTGLSGVRSLQIERYDEQSGIPTILRFAPDYEIYIPFADTPDGTWYDEAVRFCVGEGYFRGTNLVANLFEPMKDMTTAELVMVLARIAGVDVDVPATPWYAPALEWAVASGIIAEDEFVFGASLTREKFIYMFYLTANLVGTYNMEARAEIEDAVDYVSINEEYREAVSWAVETGIIKGTNTTQLTISPNAVVNRATVCQMLDNYFTNIKIMRATLKPPA